MVHLLHTIYGKHRLLNTTHTLFFIMLILLYILEFVQLQMVGGAPMHTSPYIVWPVVIILLIIVILGIRVYIIDKRKAQ